jgi:hypothetical protein
VNGQIWRGFSGNVVNLGSIEIDPPASEESLVSFSERGLGPEWGADDFCANDPSPVRRFLVSPLKIVTEPEWGAKQKSPIRRFF